MKSIKNIIAVIVCTYISISSTIISNAYFVSKAQINTDLIITTGNVEVAIDEGINTILKPGDDSEYKEFNIVNTGSLSQNIEITFASISSELKEGLKEITYELQLEESEDTYTTVSSENLENLEYTTLRYKLNPNEELNFRSKISISQDISMEAYDKALNLRLKVKAYQKSFTDYTYQDNLVTIEKPDPEEEIKYNFVTSAKTDNSDFTKITIDLKGYFDVDLSFKFDIKEKFGYLKDKPLNLIQHTNDDSVDLSFKERIDIEKISKEYPSQDKIDVEITYKKDEQIHKKIYIVEFTRQPLDEDNTQYHSEYLNVYFNEKN